MHRLLLFCALGVLLVMGCAPDDMNDMRDDLGGWGGDMRPRRPMDMALTDARTEIDAEPMELRPEPGPPLTMHHLASTYPDDLLPPPGSHESPVGCNPRTAPEGRRPRQIENRVAL